MQQKIINEIRQAVRQVYRENPYKFEWAVRKSLDPGFNVGETIAFGNGGGPYRKGKILAMGDYGATVEPTGYTGIVYRIPGMEIQKLSAASLA